MSHYRKHALKAATGLAGIAALCPAQAWAGQDPYGKPEASGAGGPPGAASSRFGSEGQRPVPEYYVLYLSASVDGRNLTQLLVLRENDQGLEIAIESAVSAGLISAQDARTASAQAAPGMQAFVRMDELKGVTYTIDRERSHIDILTARGDRRTLIDLASRPHDFDQTEPLTAAYIEYDAAITADKYGLRGAALLGANVARRNTVFNSSWRMGDNNFGSKVLHLDTSLTMLLPEKRSQVITGDFITGSTSSSRAVRMTGLQYSSNFRLQPGLVTYPVPELSGDVAVPTSVDLLLNDRRFNLGEVQEGTFDIRNVPVQSGRNAISVVVKDALGRDRIEDIDFYTSTTMLAPGMISASMSLGRVRQNYARESFDYGEMAFSGNYRRGITNRLTLGASAEISTRLRNFGLEAETVVGNFAKATVETRISQCDCWDGDKRSGSLVGGSLESYGGTLYFRMNGRLTSRNYEDLASANEGSAANSRLFGLVGFDLRKAGKVSVSVASEWNGEDRRYRYTKPDSRVASLRYGGKVGRMSVFADLSRRSYGATELLPKRGETVATAGLSMLLGRRTSGNAVVSYRQGGIWQADTRVSRPTLQPGDVGYTVEASAGEYERVRGSVEWERSDTILRAEAGWSSSGAAARVNARGAFVVAGGSAFATQPVTGGMLLVDAGGVKGIEIQRENRSAGKTRSDGKLLLTDLPAFLPTRISVNPESVPLDAVMTDSRRNVGVSPGSVSRMDIGVKRFVPRLIRLTDRYGKDIPAGTRVRAFPSQVEYIVGFDGELEINSSLADSAIEIGSPAGGVCRSDLPAGANDNDAVVVQCADRIFAMPLRNAREVDRFFASSENVVR